jgi:hypothetical protein
VLVAVESVRLTAKHPDTLHQEKLKDSYASQTGAGIAIIDLVSRCNLTPGCGRHVST